MNSTLLTSILTVSLCSAACAQTAPDPLDPNPWDVLQKNVELRVPEMTHDEFLIELGRAADINVIADATNLPPNIPVTNLPAKKTVGHAIGNFLATYHRRSVPLDQQTLLFWPAPNLLEIAAMIREEQANGPKPAAEPLSPEAAPKRWEEYFRQAHNWNGEWKGVDIQVAVDDLPADLRAQVQHEVERRLIELHQGVHVNRKASEEFWVETHLYIRPLQRRPNLPGETYMFVADTLIRPDGTGVSDYPLGPMKRPVQK